MFSTVYFASGVFGARFTFILLYSFESITFFPILPGFFILALARYVCLCCSHFWRVLLLTFICVLLRNYRYYFCCLLFFCSFKQTFTTIISIIILSTIIAMSGVYSLAFVFTDVMIYVHAVVSSISAIMLLALVIFVGFAPLPNSASISSYASKYVCVID